MRVYKEGNLLSNDREREYLFSGFLHIDQDERGVLLDFLGCEHHLWPPCVLAMNCYARSSTNLDQLLHVRRQGAFIGLNFELSSPSAIFILTFSLGQRDSQVECHGHLRGVGQHNLTRYLETCTCQTR